MHEKNRIAIGILQNVYLESSSDFLVAHCNLSADERTSVSTVLRNLCSQCCIACARRAALLVTVVGNSVTKRSESLRCAAEVIMLACMHVSE